MRKLTCLIFGVFVFLFISGVNAQTLEKDTVGTKASLYDKSRGADENIIISSSANDIPEEKQEKNRGEEKKEMCMLIINNFSPYDINIYLDGKYIGYVEGFSQSYINTKGGKKKLYGKSVCGTYYWGPTYFNCEKSYEWNLYK